MIPISEMPILATMRCSLLRKKVLIQLRDASPIYVNGELRAHVRSEMDEWMMGTFFHLYVIRPGAPRLIESIDGLRGLVNIDSQKKALEYVRLRTNPDVRYLLTKGYPEETEILSASAARKLPKYRIGSTEIDAPLPGEPDANTHYYGGYGVIQDTDFPLCGFSPPTIRTLPDNSGYEIERWMYTQVPLSESPTHEPAENPYLSDIVYKIREMVDRNGGYIREQLAVRPAPKLPRTHWQFRRPYM